MCATVFLSIGKIQSTLRNLLADSHSLIHYTKSRRTQREDDSLPIAASRNRFLMSTKALLDFLVPVGVRVSNSRTSGFEKKLTRVRWPALL